MSRSVEVIFGVLMILAYVLAPVALIWGWVRWTRSPKLKSVTSILSLCGFVLSTCSALLAVAMFVYAHAIGGFPFYDPRQMRMIRLGTLLSLTGFLCALGGIWRRSPLRWHAPVSALGTLAFWVIVGEGE